MVVRARARKERIPEWRWGEPLGKQRRRRWGQGVGWGGGVGRATSGGKVNAARKKEPWESCGTYAHTDKRSLRAQHAMASGTTQAASAADRTRLGEARRKAERKPDACHQNNAKHFQVISQKSTLQKTFSSLGFEFWELGPPAAPSNLPAQGHELNQHTSPASEGPRWPAVGVKVCRCH